MRRLPNIHTHTHTDTHTHTHMHVHMVHLSKPMKRIHHGEHTDMILQCIRDNHGYNDVVGVTEAMYT